YPSLLATVKLVACCILLATIGCSKSGPKTAPIRGTVTFDGRPVKDGDILFIPENKSLSPEAGRIVDGRYETRAKIGKNRVEISALDIGPNTQHLMGSPIAKNFIPDRYNLNSELSVDVSDASENVFPFELSSQAQGQRTGR